MKRTNASETNQASTPQQIAGIDEELPQLKTEAERLKREIVELSGEEGVVGGMPNAE